MKIRQYIELFLLKALRFLFAITPFFLLSIVCRGIAQLGYLLGFRRRVVMTNLRAAFGRNVPEEELKRIAKGCYVEFGRTIAETAKPNHIKKNIDRIFHISGLEIMEREVKRGKGVVALTGHIGNYLAAGYLSGKLGYSIKVVSKNLKNELANQEFVSFFEKYGSSLIKITGHKNDPSGGLKIMRSLKKGEVVVIMNDQDAGPDGYRSTFFGLPTYIPAGPAHFIFKSGASVITFFARRENGKIEIALQEPIDYSKAEGPVEAEKLIFDEYTKRLEEKVKEAPEQYFWLHKKWKALPEINAQYRGN